MVEFSYTPPGEYSSPAAAFGDQAPWHDESNRIEQPIQQIPPTDEEHPIVRISDIGQSVTEGSRFGTLLQTATAAIRRGVGNIELQTQMGGGGESVGAESYGQEARETLREMQRAAGVEFTTVHAPTQVGNMSGFNPQQGFSDDQRKNSLEEVKKAITFAGDIGGGGVVLHTGEFQRPMSGAEWSYERNPDGSIKTDSHGNKMYQFVAYNEEPGRAITYMVDDRTGRIISDVRRSQVIREPVYSENETGDWIDKEGNVLDPTDPEDLFKRVPEWDEEKTRFKTRKLGWTEIEERANWYNDKHGTHYTPEEVAYRIQMETQMLQYRGSSLYHGKFYDGYREERDALIKALKFAEDIEDSVPSDEQWKLVKQQLPGGRHGGEATQLYAEREDVLPSQMIKDRLDQIEKEMLYTHEASSSADAQADQVQDTLEHVKPVEAYAKNQTFQSYAEVGIQAMIETKKNPHVKKDIFIAPENIFPEMGFGSHPDEMIELITKSREKMVEYLTAKTIKDPYGRRTADGHLVDVDNPYKIANITEKQAQEAATKHIKATIDTQHLAMWKKHFMPKAGESTEEFNKRFDGWYMEQIEKLEKSNVIGHIHLVDAMGGGHHHLPPGQGTLPLVDAITYLKKKGYDGAIISEAFGEESMFGAGRIMTQTWKAFGSPVYRTFMGGPGPQTWPQMHQGYFGQNNPPFFVHGAYSPSNDWSLWSQVPME